MSIDRQLRDASAAVRTAAREAEFSASTPGGRRIGPVLALAGGFAAALLVLGGVGAAVIQGDEPAPTVGAVPDSTTTTASDTMTTAPATTTTVVTVDERKLPDADPEWVSAATAAGAVPARDDDLARAGLDMDSVVLGSGFKFPSTTQASPAIDEMGIVMFLSKDSPDSEQTWTCINDFARIGEEVIAGGGHCTTSEVSKMLSFGFSGSGSCVPSPEVAPTFLSLWGLPDEATDVSIVVGDSETLIVPVSTSGTAQVVITGQVPVWSITFKGMTDEHQVELDRFLPANLKIESVCGDAGGG